VQNVDITVSV